MLEFQKVLKRLKARIRKQILADIGDVVTTKCKEFLEKRCAKSSNCDILVTPFTLATVLQRLQPAQEREYTSPTSRRDRHFNIRVKRTRPNAVYRLS